MGSQRSLASLRPTHCACPLLADMGVGPDDDPRIACCVDQMLAHSERGGRFPRSALRVTRRSALACCSATRTPSRTCFCGTGAAQTDVCAAPSPAWESDMRHTPRATPGRVAPTTSTGFRGPGRKGDFCPLVTPWRCAALLASAGGGSVRTASRRRARRVHACARRGGREALQCSATAAVQDGQVLVTWYGPSWCSSARRYRRCGARKRPLATTAAPPTSCATTAAP